MKPVDLIKVEPAKMEDVEQIIPLAFAALSEFALYLADTEDPEVAKQYLKFAFTHPVPNEVHHSNFLVLKNEHDHIVATVSIYEGQHAPKYGDGGWEVCKEFLKSPNLVVEETQDYEADPDELYIDTISIIPEYRGQGLIEKIFQHVEIIAKEKQLPKISLVAAKHKEKLHHYYKKFGFVPTDVRHLGKHDYIHFSKKIS